MCGIAGLINYSTRLDPAEVIESMVTRLAHRGPDGEGTFVREHVAVGHRRLSIIDIADGRQPMGTDDGALQLTFNGEIYNYRQLKSELQGKGHRFRTRSDTEVVLLAYRQWGKQCVERLEGMFAFAVADFEKNEMFLARDPFGIKPLLYRWHNDSFAFASEFQAFWALPDWQAEIDLYSIDLYLRLQYIPAPRTAFRKVFKLPAGHLMTVRLGEPHHKIERYWTPDFQPKQKRSPEQLVNELDDALRDSVRRHLVSDVPFGALLSGGVDSSLVVGYMAELLDAPVKTFSIGFEDQSVNELDYARHVAKTYRTDHHEEIVHLDALGILPELVRHYGEPFGDQSAIPTWHVCQLARTQVPMVLSGDGGDELFAGYGTYGKWLQRIAYYAPPSATDWKRHIRPLLKQVFPSRYPTARRPEDAPSHWTHCVGRFHQPTRETLWRSEYRFVADQPCRELEDAFLLGHGLTGVNRPQLVDLETFLPEDILTKVDIGSMRYGLEARPPILDRKFFSTAASIPAADLSISQSDQSYSGKQPLKALLARKLGSEFAFRPKQGFVLPLEGWFRSHSEATADVQERLTDPACKLLQWFDRDQVSQTIHSGHVVNLWLLLVLEEWMCQMASHATAAA
jgi:asparagine synthase (glutamine-hydrolysing)